MSPPGDSRLVIAEGDDWVDFGGAMGGEPGGDEGDDRNGEGGGEEGEGVGGAQAEELGPDGSGGEEGGGDAESYADSEKNEGLFEDHPEDAGGLCAEGDSDSDLVGPADDVVGHDSVEADAG